MKCKDAFDKLESAKFTDEEFLEIEAHVHACEDQSCPAKIEWAACDKLEDLIQENREFLMLEGRRKTDEWTPADYAKSFRKLERVLVKQGIWPRRKK